MTYILVLLLGVINSCMDMNFNMYHKSIFSKLNPRFWNPYESWKNKWKNGNPEKGEKFFGSTTVFVFITDSWHLFKALFVYLMFFTIITYENIFGYYDFIIYLCLWFLGFEATKIFLTKKT